MKKVIATFLFAITLVLSSPFLSRAQNIDCSVIDGASIYGHTYNGKWEFIGSISNPYGSNSIANDYGTYGSPYASKSINNEYGTYGNPYSSYSAFNDYATNPPVLVTTDNRWGYLTTNEYKGSSISPYIAIACAKQSYR